MGAHTKRLAGTGAKILLLISTPLLALVLVLVATQPSLRAQSAAGNAPTSQTPTPQWQIDAGSKKEFDVASVKPDTTEPSPTNVTTNIALGPGDYYSPTGGLF